MGHAIDIAWIVRYNCMGVVIERIKIHIMKEIISHDISHSIQLPYLLYFWIYEAKREREAHNKANLSPVIPA